MAHKLLSHSIEPNWKGLVDCIMKRGTPDRVYYIELLLDEEIKTEISRRFGIDNRLNSNDPYYHLQREMHLQRLLGYDYVRCGLDNFNLPLRRSSIEDTADLQRPGGREFIEEHRGPITTWREFESYPWPDMNTVSTQSLQWFNLNLPENMCIIGSGGFAHFAEYLMWLMGYESFCYSLYEQRDLVLAIRDRLIEIFRLSINLLLSFERVKIIWGSDDMGFRSETFISPDELRSLVLPGHKLMAQKAHNAGRPYLLHSCGNLSSIMNDLIDDVGIDAKHSFEDTIEDVVTAKRRYGDRIALLGGIDVDFLCRSDEEQIRKRVRWTLEECMPQGGYCLGTGNSVANYIPLNHYLAMLDEGRSFGL